MLNPDNETLEWCAKWIEDSLSAETNERTIAFGKNMAMTIRAVKTDTRVPPAVPLDAERYLRERDEIVNAVLKRIGKRWRSMPIAEVEPAKINGPMAAIVADQEGAALVAVNMALDALTTPPAASGPQPVGSPNQVPVLRRGNKTFTEVEAVEIIRDTINDWESCDLKIKAQWLLEFYDAHAAHPAPPAGGPQPDDAKPVGDLHLSVCDAVALLNQVVHKQEESRQAHDILRQALVDYADSARPAQPSAPETPDPETEAVARGIRLDLCHCLDAHKAPNGFAVEAVTCVTHQAITAALTSTRSQLLKNIRDAVEAVRRPASRRFSVRFVNHVQGTNSAEWECDICKTRWCSAGNLECPNGDNEVEPKVTDADAIYNLAINDALAAIDKVAKTSQTEPTNPSET